MKRIISILLTVTLVFSLFATFVSAEEIADQATENRSFHAPTIRKMIDVNLELQNIDEEFYHLLTNAYLTDPALLARTIADLSEDEIAYLAKAISYDLQKTDRVDQAMLPEDCGSTSANAVARMIFTEAGNAANATLMAFMDAEIPTAAIASAAETNETQSLFINMHIPAAPNASVAAPLSVALTIVSHTAVSYDRTFFYQIHKVIDGVDSTAALAQVTLPANKIGVTITKDISLNTAEEYTIYGVLLADRVTVIDSSASQTVTVNGKWHITVELTADRSQLGTITLYDASGTEVSSSVCLGRASGNPPMNQIGGNTPIGVYTAYLDGTRSNTLSYGPYQVIRIIGQSGYVVEQCSHRSGLLIHGGRESYYEGTEIGDPDFKLCPTEGCVRVMSEYQLQLENEITNLITNNHDTVGIVTITQDGQTTL